MVSKVFEDRVLVYTLVLSLCVPAERAKVERVAINGIKVKAQHFYRSLGSIFSESRGISIGNFVHYFSPVITRVQISKGVLVSR